MSTEQIIVLSEEWGRPATGVCVGGKWHGWYMTRGADGQWITSHRLASVNPADDFPLATPDKTASAQPPAGEAVAREAEFLTTLADVIERLQVNASRSPAETVRRLRGIIPTLSTPPARSDEGLREAIGREVEEIIDAKVKEIDDRYTHADHRAQHSFGYAIDRLSELRNSIRAALKGASDATR